MRHTRDRRKSIYVNRLFTTRIKQLSPLESRHLLELLYNHVVADEPLLCDCHGSLGTVAIWDNRSTQHKPVNDFFHNTAKCTE
ncbi:MAG: hypothetical protein CM15mP68_4890 [Pseudomonadota bacterium]|nr:MAG: hypothetical protein CM15mP68_4890 [Pseudomonadota bacterium]